MLKAGWGQAATVAEMQTLLQGPEAGWKGVLRRASFWPTVDLILLDRLR